MAEQAPIPQPDERFRDIYASQFLKPGNEIQMPGDPAPEDFARAHAYLETITAHLIEFGPVWEKTQNDLMAELQHNNAWMQYEVEQERRAGDKTAEYRAITIQHLRALSKRRVLAFEDSGWEVTYDYRVVQHVDALIEQAALEQEQLELRVASTPGQNTRLEAPADASDDVPF